MAVLFLSVPPIQPVNGRVVFFRKEREKISTLEPLTSWIFAVAFRRRKRRTGLKQSCPPLPSTSFYGKTGSTTFLPLVGFYGGSAPAPPTSPKEQD